MVDAQIFIMLSRGGWHYRPPLEMVFQGRLMPPAAPENRAHFQGRLMAQAAPALEIGSLGARDGTTRL